MCARVGEPEDAAVPLKQFSDAFDVIVREDDLESGLEIFLEREIAHDIPGRPSSLFGEREHGTTDEIWMSL